MKKFTNWAINIGKLIPILPIPPTVFTSFPRLCDEDKHDRHYQGVNGYRFSEGDSQNHIGQYCSSGFGIAAYRLQSAQANEADTNSGAYSSQTHSHSGSEQLHRFRGHSYPPSPDWMR
jgi:hypothetical protein